MRATHRSRPIDTKRCAWRIAARPLRTVDLAATSDRLRSPRSHEVAPALAVTLPAPRTPAPLSPDDIARIRAPFRGARLLPGQAYHDEDIFAWEQEEIFFRDWLAVGRAEEVPEPGSFLVRDVLGESVLLVRGRDDEVRAFYNVCRHRGTAVEERECGKAVRFQCPYHAWIYDLDGSLVRAKHTDDLDDFSLDTYGLAPIRCQTWQGFLFLCFADESVTPGLRDLHGRLVRAPRGLRPRPGPPDACGAADL